MQTQRGSVGLSYITIYGNTQADWPTELPHVMKLILNMTMYGQVGRWKRWQTCFFLYITLWVVTLNNLSLSDLSAQLLNFILIRGSTYLQEEEQARFNTVTIQVIVAITTLRWEWNIIFCWCKVSLFNCVVTKFAFKFSRVEIPNSKFCVNFPLRKQREASVFNLSTLNTNRF